VSTETCTPRRGRRGSLPPRRASAPARGRASRCGGTRSGTCGRL
jgi:hypothetical protein